MKLLLRAARLALGAAVLYAATPACYSAGDGTAPPHEQLLLPHGPRGLDGGQRPLRRQLRLRPAVERRHPAELRPLPDPSGHGRPHPGQPLGIARPRPPASRSSIPGCPTARRSPPPPDERLSGNGLLLGEALRPAGRLHPVRARLGHHRRVRHRPPAARVLGGHAAVLRPSPGTRRSPGPTSASTIRRRRRTRPSTRRSARRAAAAPSRPSRVLRDAGRQSLRRRPRDGQRPDAARQHAQLTMPGEPFGLAQSRGRHRHRGDAARRTPRRRYSRPASARLTQADVRLRPCSSCWTGCRTAEWASPRCRTTRSPSRAARTSATSSPASARPSSRRAATPPRSTSSATTPTTGASLYRPFLQKERT